MVAPQSIAGAKAASQFLSTNAGGFLSKTTTTKQLKNRTVVTEKQTNVKIWEVLVGAGALVVGAAATVASWGTYKFFYGESPLEALMNWNSEKKRAERERQKEEDKIARRDRIVEDALRRKEEERQKEGS